MAHRDIHIRCTKPAMTHLRPADDLGNDVQKSVARAARSGAKLRLPGLVRYTLRVQRSPVSHFLNPIGVLIALLAIARFGPNSAMGEEPPKPPPAPQDQLQLRKTNTPPTFTANQGYDPIWEKRIREGVDAAREYLGNYGPVHIYVAGQMKEELKKESDGQTFIDTMCRRRHPESTWEQRQCHHRVRTEQIEKARNPETTEAYLSGIDYVDVPFAELIFINPHNFGAGEVQSRAIHEYTHVRQLALPAFPNWMMEGGAELLAWHLGELNGWSNLNKFMGHALNMLDEAEGDYTIRDFEPQQPTKAGAEKYIRHFAYDGGAWAVAFIIHASPTRSIRDYNDRFYPLVATHGWKKALTRYAGFEGADDFYEQFEAFRQRPRNEKMELLSEIRK